jgi:hypothetical protein
MMIAMLSVVLLAIIGMAFMLMANTETAVNGNYKSSQKAYFASRGGLENVRVLLQQGGNLYNQAAVMGMPVSNAKTGVIYVFNSAGPSDPTSASGTLTSVPPNPALDDELCHEQFGGMAPLSAGSLGVPCGSGPGGPGELMGSAIYYNTPATAVTTSTVPFTWVRVTNKQNYMGLVGQDVDGSDPTKAAASVLGEQVCWDGNHEIAVPPGTCATANPTQVMNPVLVLTSLAVTPGFGNNPGSRRMTQMEVAFAPPLTPNATIAAQAPINLQGNLQVNGYDNCNCTSTGTAKPGRTCNKNTLAVYSGQPFCGNNSSCTPGVGQTGNAATLTSGLGNGLTIYNQANGTTTTQGATGQGAWNYDIPTLVQQYSASASNASGAPWNISCSPTSGIYLGCGTVSGQTFGNYPQGMPANPSWPPGQGPSQVYIPGSVQLTGNTSGAGVLIINGDLDVHGGLDFYGLILVRGKIKFTGGGSQNINMFGALLAGEDVNAQDIAILDTVGGSFSFQYDSCALKQFTQKGPPSLLATHEVMY